MRNILIALIFAWCSLTTLYAQDSIWKRIDTSCATIAVVGTRLFAQYYYPNCFAPRNIMFSDDRGISWRLVTHSTKLAPDITKIVRHPKYLLALPDYFGEKILYEPPTLLRSYTNGATWDSVALPQKYYQRFNDSLGGNYSPDDVTIKDTSIFLALSKAWILPADGVGFYGGIILRSENDGVIWDTTYSVKNVLDVDLYQQRLAANPSTVLAIKADQAMVQLSNNDKDWKIVDGIPTQGRYNPLASNTKHFFAAYQPYSSGGNITKKALWRSNNQGTEWSMIVGENNEVKAITTNDAHLVVSTQQNGLLYSKDQGTTWQSFNKSDKDSSYTYIGSLGISDDGWIYGSGTLNNELGIFRRKLPAVITSVRDVSNAEITLFPNPCTNVVTISYSKNEQQAVQIELCSLLGQTVAVNVDNTTVGGRKFYPLDVSEIPNGTYFLSIKNRADVKTVMLQIMR